MTPILYAHPFSSYSQKALIALYEHAIAFDYRALTPERPENFEALRSIWPFGKFPVLVENGRRFAEATIIIERLDALRRGGPPLVPDDPQAALDARFLDRVFDNYVMTPMNAIVVDAMRDDDEKSPRGVAEARALLDTAYAWLDATLRDRVWAAGDAFTLADCAAAPSLFYADWTHEIAPRFAALRAYRARLLARPSVARCVEEARPYRGLFPPGAPDRD